MHSYRCNKRPSKNEMYTYGLVGIAKNIKRIVILRWLLLGGKHPNRHGKNTKNEKMKGTFNKRGTKIQFWYYMRVLSMKERSVNSVNKGNRSNNLGGTIMAVAG